MFNDSFVKRSSRPMTIGNTRYNSDDDATAEPSTITPPPRSCLPTNAAVVTSVKATMM